MKSNFKNENLSLFQKGEFVEINNEFLTEVYSAIEPLAVLQNKYDKNDDDTFLNEYKDSVTARMLGYSSINIEKHGFDAKNDSNFFLEVKSVSFSTKTWGATFNDTNLEKAEAFKDKKVFLAVAVWSGFGKMEFIAFGQNPGIGYFLEERVNSVASTSTRSTQAISFQKLVKDYGFKIIVPPTSSIECCKMKLQLKHARNEWVNDAKYIQK